MGTLASVFVVLVALEHLYFLVLEMFLWTKPKALKAFKMTQEYAESTRVMAANQGLYNGFLAVGLILGLCGPEPVARCFREFFLACVVVAGVFGGATVGKKIFLLQAVPAALALILGVLS